MDKTLESGAELHISTTFEDSHRLFRVICQELKEVKIDLGEGFDFKNPLQSDASGLISTIKGVALSLIGSDRVDEAMWKCMARATYDNKKCTKDLFDDENIREDYLIVATEVMMENLRPFLKNLGSSLKTILQQKNTNTQK